MVGGGRPRVSIAAVVASAVVVVGLPAIAGVCGAVRGGEAPAVVESTATAKMRRRRSSGRWLPRRRGGPGSLPELHASSGEGFSWVFVGEWIGQQFASGSGIRTGR